MQSFEGRVAAEAAGTLSNVIWGLVPGLSQPKAPAQLSDYPLYLQVLVANGVLGVDELTRMAKGGRTSPLALEAALLPITGKEKLLQALATDFQVPALDLDKEDVSPQVALVVPSDVATHGLVACVDLDEDGMTLAMADPRDEAVVTQVQMKTDFKVTRRVVALGSDLRAFHEVLYGTPRNLTVSPRDIVDDIIKMAIQHDASDIHIEPLEDEILVRFRKDGVLISTFDLRQFAPRKVLIRHLKTALPVVVKNKSGASGKTMNIAETQRPQDGRIYLPARGLDLRVSVLPSVHGESVVIRIHRSHDDEVDFRKLGFSQRTYEDFLSIIQAPYGILLVSGPTGSGKTTTLYNVLRHLNDPGKKILTIEDPVECTIPRVTQVQTNAARGVTFAEALRSFLRHDPDIIMVGEIRDQETALMAVEASLTGHLVLSSIHANDAVRTITRIKDLGVNPMLITSTCLGTLAQRLIRTVCENCKEPARFTGRFYRLMERYHIPYRKDRLFQGKGCARCSNTGYAGRTGIYELMLMTPALRDAILANAQDIEVERLARRQGMGLLLEEALHKVALGITTEAEVLRVTLADTFSTHAADPVLEEPRSPLPATRWRPAPSELEHTDGGLGGSGSEIPELPRIDDLHAEPGPAARPVRERRSQRLARDGIGS